MFICMSNFMFQVFIGGLGCPSQIKHKIHYAISVLFIRNKKTCQSLARQKLSSLYIINPFQLMEVSTRSP